MEKYTDQFMSMALQYAPKILLAVFIKFDVRPWCKSEHYWDVYYFMQENIKRQFDAQGVQAPRQQ